MIQCTCGNPLVSREAICERCDKPVKGRASKFSYRVTSNRTGSSLQPQTFTHTLGGAIDAAMGHAGELPGCVTLIERKDGNGWKLWHSGNWDVLHAGLPDLLNPGWDAERGQA